MLTTWLMLPSFALVNVETEIDGTQSYYCAQQMTALGDELIGQYQTFLDTQTSDPGDNSDKLDIVMTFYRYVVGRLDDGFDEWTINDLTGESLGTTNDEYQHCDYVRDYYITVADSMLRTFYIASSSSKTTYQVVDGLKAMNADLNDMSQSFHATFPSMFNKFNNAFPCYINSCVGR
jgi:hypothetical protein